MIREDKSGSSDRKRQRMRLCAIAGIVAAVLAVALLPFAFGDSSIVRMETPENSEKEQFIEEGNEILRRFRAIDWELVHPRNYLEDEDWYTNIVCLAKLPDDGIAMYGYNDEEYHDRGVAIAFGDTMYYLDWFYFSPRQILPQMYWNDAEQQLLVSLHLFTGTGVAAEELHVLQMAEGREPEDYVFANGNYASLLSERIRYSYEKDAHRITFYDERDHKELMQTDLSWLEEKEVEGLVFGDIGRFQLGEETYLIFTPGYMVREWASPQYEEIPEMTARVVWKIENGEMLFELGEIDLVKEER